MIETWKKQFALKQLSLEHDKPEIFIKCQWQREKNSPNIIYLFYRWIVALVFFITFLLSVIDLRHPNASKNFKAKWLIYLTNWGYTVCTIQALIPAILLTMSVLRKNFSNIPGIYKIYWLFNTIATDVAFGITTLYWSIIYDKKIMPLDAMNILVHANNSILMMLDLFMVSHPIRLLHCCYPVLFGLCYTIFSIIFHAAGGISKEGHTYIYTILNWNQPVITLLICVGVTTFLVIIHIFTWILFKFRLNLQTKYFHKFQQCNDNDDKKIDIVRNI